MCRWQAAAVAPPCPPLPRHPSKTSPACVPAPFPFRLAARIRHSVRGSQLRASRRQVYTTSLARSPSSIRFACREQHATRHAAHGSFVRSPESQRTSSTGFDHGYRSPAVFRRANPINACASLRSQRSRPSDLHRSSRVTFLFSVSCFQRANESTLSLERFSGIVRPGDRKSAAASDAKHREPGESERDRATAPRKPSTATPSFGGDDGGVPATDPPATATRPLAAIPWFRVSVGILVVLATGSYSWPSGLAQQRRRGIAVGHAVARGARL